ncbi:MAG: homocysteine S-methyltransferase family protein, partial [Flavobacteriales bacterium]|nr:homocysteine S-methyltransferase family protein [Flavobacteriales bacterium]
MSDIRDVIGQRIIILDGAMGTMIQSAHLKESDYTHPVVGLCRGLNDLLNLTRADVIEDIHRQYIEAGADIISTNTFNASAISLADYGMEEYVDEINTAAVRIARHTASSYDKEVWVAGVLGPTGRTASLSPDVNDAAERNITYDELYEAYSAQVKVFDREGADIILIETVFDSLNAKAAIRAAKDHSQLPIMLSGTISDASGRLLSGQTIEAFCDTFSSMGLLSIGLNCALGASELKPYIKRLSCISPIAVSSHPNAGLPDGFGSYAQSSEEMAAVVEGYMKDGLVNIIGGCCGTTPQYIKMISTAAKNHPPRPIPQREKCTTLAGLDSFYIRPEDNFINIGERANVAGSARFARLVREEK